MKRLFLLLMVTMMIFSAPIVVQAADAKLSVSGAIAKRGEMIELSVSLSDCKEANTIGISMEYDSVALKKIVSDCKWEKEGSLQDFNVSKDDGVWTANNAQNLNGKICTLAFRIKSNAPIGDTEVTCKVVVKKDSKLIGTYTAKGTVSVVCEHSYGESEKFDGKIHKMICRYCGYEKKISHEWNEGVVTKEPTAKEEGLRVYECSVCGERKEERFTANSGETQNKPPRDESSRPDNSLRPDDSLQPDNPLQPDNSSQPDNSLRPNNTNTRPENSKQEDTDKTEQDKNNMLQSNTSKPENSENGKPNISNSEQSEGSEKEDENITKPSGSKPTQSDGASQKNEDSINQESSFDEKPDVDIQSDKHEITVGGFETNLKEEQEGSSETMKPIEDEHRHEHEQEDINKEQQVHEDEKIDEVEKNADYYQWVCYLIIVIGILVFAIIKIKRNKK